MNESVNQYHIIGFIEMFITLIRKTGTYFVFIQL